MVDSLMVNESQVGQRKKKVLILWSRISGYGMACWSELAKAGCEVDVVYHAPGAGSGPCELAASGIDGLRLAPIRELGIASTSFVNELYDALNPDAIFVSGWLSPGYRKFVTRLPRGNPSVIMGMDTPLPRLIKRWGVKLKMGSFLRRVNSVFVAGERSWQYARALGFEERQIVRGLYGWDGALANGVLPSKAGGGWLFVGRYVPQKGIDCLLEAYRCYRRENPNPWELHVCGTGPLESKFRDVPGIRNHGYIAPEKLPEIFASVRGFVFPSVYEPWGVALAEAMGHGLPAIASESVGSAIDLIREGWNGILVPTGSVQHLAKAFSELQRKIETSEIPEYRCQLAAEPYKAEFWPKKFCKMLE